MNGSEHPHGFLRPFWEVCKIKTIFIIIGRHYLLFSPSLSYKCAVYNKKHIDMTSDSTLQLPFKKLLLSIKEY